MGVGAACAGEARKPLKPRQRTGTLARRPGGSECAHLYWVKLCWASALWQGWVEGGRQVIGEGGRALAALNNARTPTHCCHPWPRYPQSGAQSREHPLTLHDVGPLAAHVDDCGDGEGKMSATELLSSPLAQA